MALVTTTTTVPPAVTSYFNKKLLWRAQPFLAHEKVCQQQKMPMNAGNTMVFRLYPSLSLQLATLVEGSPPTGKQLSKSDKSVTLVQHGDFVTVTDFGMMTIENDILNVAADVLGEQEGQSMDALIRDTAVAGTTVFYGGTAAARTDLTTTTHKVTTDVLNRIIRTLNTQNAKKFTDIVNATTRIGTGGMNAAYWGITHPDVAFTLRTLTGWQDVKDYAEPGARMPGEIGAYREIRFMQSSQAKLFAGAGGTASGDVKSTGGLADVYTVLVFGREAIATVPLSGKSSEMINKPLGSAGVADPLNQLATSGWKATGARLILNDNFMARLEVTVGNTAP